MEMNKIGMKDLLSQGLYLMMKEKAFDKITIKEICDKTGVIRGTFYNHFIDKYEALEYLTFQIILGDWNQQESKFSKGNQIQLTLFEHIIHAIDENKDFFIKCFKIQGQNSFESMLRNIFYDLIINDCQDITDSSNRILITKQYLAKYLSNSMYFIIEDWINHNCNRSCDELLQMCNIFSKLSLYDLTKK